MSFISTVVDQKITFIPSFKLECGRTLRDVPVAYKTWGRLNKSKDNVMVVCHAFTGSADVEDWWGPLIGPGKALDYTRFFVFCANALGSSYGSASPITMNPDTGRLYGPEFPPTTVRDDVRIHKLVLDQLGVKSIAVVTGGSLGGMASLEWPLCTEPGYVRHTIPIGTSARHSAWCISWDEVQRQCIYTDPNYENGYYSQNKQPNTGLAAARMIGILTYHSHAFFERRFGRKPQPDALLTAYYTPSTPAEEALALHNDGHRSTKPWPSTETPRDPSGQLTPQIRLPMFSVLGYLRHHGEKFTTRFDANCYIHISRKMDAHDITRGRVYPSTDDSSAVGRVLRRLPRALIVGVQSDGLALPSDQRQFVDNIPKAELVMIQSEDGHDGFLIEFEELNRHIFRFLKDAMPEYYKEGATDRLTTWKAKL